MITIACAVCGCPFEVKPYRKETAKFCSRSCGGKHQLATRKMRGPSMVGNKYRLGKKPGNSFSVGHIPWNRGAKGIHLSPESEFKKGVRSIKWMPVGTVKIRKDKNGTDRAFVKVEEPRKWALRAILVWEQENGPVPTGSVVHHKDRNTLNDSPANLKCLTRAEHLGEHRSEIRLAKELPSSPRTTGMACCV